jgi:PAS domain-containing protein
MKNKPAIETASTIRHLRDQASHDRVRLEALFSSIGEGVVASDENGIITRANQRLLYQYTTTARRLVLMNGQ